MYKALYELKEDDCLLSQKSQAKCTFISYNALLYHDDVEMNPKIRCNVQTVITCK